jgi:hypothetical protein
VILIGVYQCILAWLVFPSESVAEKAHDQLKGKKFHGEDLFVDFCGTVYSQQT